MAVMTEKLYACIKTPHIGGKWIMRNEIVHLNEAYQFEGFEFKIISVSEKGCIQLVVYAYSLEHTQLLGNINDGLGKRIGMKMDSLYLFTDQYADCDYALHFSKTPTDDYLVFYYSGLSEVLIDDNYEKTVHYLSIKNRVDGFQEMMDYCENNYQLFKSTKRMEEKTRVYEDDYISPKIPEKDGIVSFEENLTLSAVKRFIGTNKKVAVLNFANPIEPGGGVLRGANAQEEYLCRSTNLYRSLTSKNAEKYYSDNNSIRSANQFNSMFIGTDEVIYSPHVTVLKKADGYGTHKISGYKEIYEDQYYDIEVLTCAAPFFSGSGYIIPNGDLKYILMRRIRNIFEVAIENDVDILVLGAFGCGAFHNPPEVVADAFRECLLELRYLNAFDEVVFAVKREAIPSRNIEMFERAFSAFPKYNEDGYERYIQKHLKR